MSKQLHMNWSPFYVFFVQKKCKRLNSEIFLNLDFFCYCHSAGWLWYLYCKNKIFSLLFASCPFVVADNFSFSLSGGRYLLSVPFMQSIINHAGRSCWILGSLISEALCKKKRTAFSAVDVNITWAEKDLTIFHRWCFLEHSKCSCLSFLG